MLSRVPPNVISVSPAIVFCTLHALSACLRCFAGGCPTTSTTMAEAGWTVPSAFSGWISLPMLFPESEIAAELNVNPGRWKMRQLVHRSKAGGKESSREELGILPDKENFSA